MTKLPSDEAMKKFEQKFKEEFETGVGHIGVTLENYMELGMWAYKYALDEKQEENRLLAGRMIETSNSNTCLKSEISQLQKENEELKNIIHGHQPLEQIFQLQKENEEASINLQRSQEKKNRVIAQLKKDKEELVKCLEECVEGLRKLCRPSKEEKKGWNDEELFNGAFEECCTLLTTAEGILGRVGK